MKKKVLSILLVSVLSISLFAGCTNTTDTNNSATSNQEQQESNNNEESSAENKEDEPSFENKEEESNTGVEEVIGIRRGCRTNPKHTGRQQH